MIIFFSINRKSITVFGLQYTSLRDVMLEVLIGAVTGWWSMKNYEAVDESLKIMCLNFSCGWFLHTLFCRDLWFGLMSNCRYIFSISATAMNLCLRNLNNTENKPDCTTGPRSTSPFDRLAVVFADPTKTTRSFVVTLSSLMTEWWGKKYSTSSGIALISLMCPTFLYSLVNLLYRVFELLS